IFPGLDGNFEKRYTASPLLPLGTEYMKIQVLARPSLGSDSMYQIDDIQVKDVTPDSLSQYKTNLNLVGTYQNQELKSMQQLPTNVSYSMFNGSTSLAPSENDKDKNNVTSNI